MKTVKEITLWLKNVPGSLSTVSDLFAENRINIVACYAIALNREKDGEFRFVANDPEKALNVLKTAGYPAEVADVIACEVPHHPGGLNIVLKALKTADINVDYMYPCIGTGNITVLIMGVTPVQEALKVMEEHWIRIIGDKLYSM